MSKAKKPFKLPPEITAIDTRNLEYYNSLNDDERKQLDKSYFTLMIWISSVTSNVDAINEHYVTQVNEMVNKHFSVISKHPELMFRLFQNIGLGTKQQHRWIAPAKRKKSAVNNKLHDFFVKLHPELNDDEIEIVISGMEKTDIRAMLEDAGIPKAQIKDYLK